MAEYLRSQQSERQIPEVDMLQGIWTAIMTDLDWTAKPEQLEGLALKSIKVRAHHLYPLRTVLLLICWWFGWVGRTTLR